MPDVKIGVCFVWSKIFRERYLPANEAVLSRKRKELQESRIGPPSRRPPDLKTPPGDVPPIALGTFTFQTSKDINQIYFVVHQLHLHWEGGVALFVLRSCGNFDKIVPRSGDLTFPISNAPMKDHISQPKGKGVTSWNRSWKFFNLWTPYGDFWSFIQCLL